MADQNPGWTPLADDQTPGARARPSPDPFEPFVDYVTGRLAEDPRLWARTLFDECCPSLKMRRTVSL